MSRDNDLGQLMSALGKAQLPRHVQHLYIRLKRLTNSLSNAAGPSSSTTYDARDQLETLVRIKGRVQEIEESLMELANELHEPTGPGGRSQDDQVQLLSLARLTHKVAQQLDSNLKEVVRVAKSSNAERESNEDLPRKLATSAAQSVDESAPPRAAQSISPTSAIKSFLASTKVHSQRDASKTTAVKQLLDARALYTLSSRPDHVLPSGKTIGTVFREQLLRQPSDSSDDPSRVEKENTNLDEEALTRGLSSTSSAERCVAWSKLRSQIWNACAPLIPAKLDAGRARLDLEAQLCREEPFDQVTQATTLFKYVVVKLLARLCAPSRDSQVADLEARIAHRTSEVKPGTHQDDVRQLVGIFKGTLDLAVAVKADLSTFRANATAAMMNDDDWERLVEKEAGERERKAVLELVGGSEAVKSATKAWLAVAQGERTQNLAATRSLEADAIDFDSVAQALVGALFQETAVSTALLQEASQGDQSNSATTTRLECLPPIFAVPVPQLVVVQNMLQAIIILACLSALVRIPAQSTEHERLMERLWIILAAASTESIPTGADEGTKLNHIADELIEASRRVSSATPTVQQGQAEVQQEFEREAQRLKAGVNRILRYEEPVYKLFKSRLKDALSNSAVRMLRRGQEAGETTVATPGPATLVGTVARLRTGRISGSSSPRISEAKKARPALETIKGFERVMDRVQLAAQQIHDVLLWCWETWEATLA